MKPATQTSAANSQARIGHVHLKVADLGRAVSFYRDVLGFEHTQRLALTAAFYWDTPQDPWSRNDKGELVMFTHPLSLYGLHREASRN